MDELARKLREDAAKIDADVSAQLESRIQASLNAVEPDALRQRKSQRRPVSFWLASSLTGVAAALAVIVVLNLGDTPEPVAVPQVVANTPALPMKWLLN